MSRKPKQEPKCLHQERKDHSTGGGVSPTGGGVSSTGEAVDTTGDSVSDSGERMGAATGDTTGGSVPVV